MATGHEAVYVQPIFKLTAAKMARTRRKSMWTGVEMYKILEGSNSS